VPGGGTATYSPEGYSIEIPNIGRGCVNADGMITIPNVGTVTPDAILAPDGHVIFDLAPDGRFKPKGMSDAEWFFIWNPSSRHLQELFDSDQKEKERTLRQNWDYVIYGTDINWTEYDNFGRSIAIAAVERNPSPVCDYVKDLAVRMRNDFQRNAYREFQRVTPYLTDELINKALNSVIGLHETNVQQILEFRVTIGIQTYAHTKTFSADFPTESGADRRSVTFAGPNTFRPYIAINVIREISPGLAEPPSTTVRAWHMSNGYEYRDLGNGSWGVCKTGDGILSQLVEVSRNRWYVTLTDNETIRMNLYFNSRRRDLWLLGNPLRIDYGIWTETRVYASPQGVSKSLIP